MVTWKFMPVSNYKALHSLRFRQSGKRMNAVLIIGCGDIGRRVAGALPGVAVTGLVQTATSAGKLRSLGIDARQVDLDASPSVAQLPASGREVYYFAPPPSRGDSDTRVAAVCELLQGDNLPTRVVYISTSAVYGDCAGAWIDEDAPLRPGTDRGRRRLDAERRWLRWSEQTGVPVVILRVPGIYAHDRLPVKRLRDALPVLAEADSPFTNRIHADDLARVCIAAMRQGQSGEAYNVSDGHPTTMTDYFNQVADRLGLPRPPVVPRAEAERVLSASMLSFLGESKRLDNRRMCQRLGVQLMYPDLAAGLAAADAETAG
jgi:nucleoside-diphosphate-sugar epimerase